MLGPPVGHVRGFGELLVVQVHDHAWLVARQQKDAIFFEVPRDLQYFFAVVDLLLYGHQIDRLFELARDHRGALSPRTSGFCCCGYGRRDAF